MRSNKKEIFDIWGKGDHPHVPRVCLEAHRGPKRATIKHIYFRPPLGPLTPPTSLHRGPKRATIKHIYFRPPSGPQTPEGILDALRIMSPAPPPPSSTILFTTSCVLEQFNKLQNSRFYPLLNLQIVPKFLSIFKHKNFFSSYVCNGIDRVT